MSYKETNKITDLSDISSDVIPEDGQALIYNSLSGQYEPGAAGAAEAKVLKPDNQSPSDGATDVPADSTLQASDCYTLYTRPQADSQWRVSESSDFSTTVINTLGGSVTSFSLAEQGLSGDVVYYWQVKYQDSANNWSEWSDVTSFTTASVYIQKPSDLSPTDGVTGVGKSPTLSTGVFVCVDGSDTHASSDWQISTNVEFTNIIWQSTDDTVNLESITVPEGNLLESTQYFWRVRHTGTTYGNSEWSNIYDFTTKSLFYDVYGIYWDYVNDTITDGILQSGGGWIDNVYTDFPVQEKMYRCIVNETGVNYYLHADDSRRKDTPTTTGTTDGTTTNHLLDSTKQFSTDGLVNVNDYVYNQTDGTYAQVIAVNDYNLSLDADIFTTGEDYEIGSNLTGTDGQVMVEIPSFYMLTQTDSVNDLHYFMVSESFFTFNGANAWIPKAFDGHDYIYIGAFQGTALTDATDASVGSVVKDTSGYSTNSYPNPISNRTRPQFRSQCSSTGTPFCQFSYGALEIIQILYITEYKNWNSQTELPGYTEAGSFVYGNTSEAGQTISLGNGSGSVGDGATKGSANSFRGIENIFGNVWVFADGININSGHVYTAYDPANFADNTTTNYTDTGVSPGFGTATNYQKDIEADGNQHASFWPVEIGNGADSASYLTDYMWNDIGWRVLRVGGGCAGGALAGLGSRYANYASTNAAAGIGARLLAYV